MLAARNWVAAIDRAGVEVFVRFRFEDALTVVAKLCVATYFALLATVAREGLVLALTSHTAVQSAELQVVAVAVELTRATPWDFIIDAANDLVTEVIRAVVVVAAVDED